MVDKSLRILIANASHPQTLLVERMLNRLGYYRIATTYSLTEAEILGRCTGNPFDLMIVSGRLIVGESQGCPNLAGVCRNALIYLGQLLPAALPGVADGGTVARLLGALDVASLRMFMALIDPQLAAGTQRLAMRA